MNTTTPPGEPAEPSPEDIARGLAQLEKLAQPEHIAAPSTPVEDDEPLDDDELFEEEEPATPLVLLADGETRRVRRLSKQVAESHLLARLQADETPLLLDTPKVAKRRHKAREAARLHLLSQDPAALAYGAAKARRRVNTTLSVALILALGWSTAGVHTFASDSAPQWSPGWTFAWFVEPFMSIALLAFVGAKAYFATRGQPAHDPVLSRIERFFLALTLGMNAFPYLPLVAETFRFPMLVLHLVGPAVAYMIVTGWPRLLARFATLDHGLDRDPVAPPTVVAYSANARSGRDHRELFGGTRNGVSEAEHRRRLHHLITAGQLPAKPSATAIRKALGCAAGTASQLRDELTAGGPNPDLDEE